MPQACSSVLGDLDPLRLGEARQHPVELLVLETADVHLVVDASEERLITEGLGIEVGREHHLDLERHLELAAAEREVVDLTVERNDPPVQELLGGHRLTAEVIDDEDAVVRLELEWSEIGAHLAIEAQVQHAGVQLPAGDDGGAMTHHPTGIELRRLLVEGVVEDRVEHVDDLTLDLDAMRDQHGVGVRPDESLGDRRLAGSRRTVEEDGTLAADRRAELIDQRR